MTRLFVQVALLATIATQASALYTQMGNTANQVSSSSSSSSNSNSDSNSSSSSNNVVVVNNSSSSSSSTPSNTPSSASSSSSSPSASASNVASSSSSSAAQPTSTTLTPLGSSTDVFTQGQACRASWTPDESGATTWQSMTIDLMTGSNDQMVKLGTVASGIDGTDPNNDVYWYTCPDVTPNAAIYFLQYTHDNGKDPTWTTRFAIANDAGIYFPAPEANQPQGGSPAIPWGLGMLVINETASTSSSSSSKNQSNNGTSTVLTTTSNGQSNANAAVSHRTTSLLAATAALGMAVGSMLLL